MKLNSKQKDIAIKQLKKKVNSDSQYYFRVEDNCALHENEIDKQQINRMIDNMSIIPFVPAFDLKK